VGLIFGLIDVTIHAYACTRCCGADTYSNSVWAIIQKWFSIAAIL